MTPLESHALFLAVLALSLIPTAAIIAYDRLRGGVEWEEEANPDAD